jgi:DNA-binding beta-propeller fold protein YncE
VLGEKFVPGSDENHFCAPADVAVDRGSGDIFVADGYCNSRIVKFDKSGRFLLQFGAGSVHPWIPVIPFNVTHSVTIAYTTTENRQESIIFVADRNNGRVQSFTENGLFLYEIGHEVFSGNEATTTMIFSIAQVEMEHSKNVITDSKSPETRNCLLYATTGNVPYGQAKVFELLIGKSIFSLLSSFSVSKADEKFREGYQSLHDILVSEDGKDIYIVQTNNYFMLSKFTKEHLYVTSQSNVLTEPIWTLFIFAIQYHLFT